jgi:hypothetical protein
VVVACQLLDLFRQIDNPRTIQRFFTLVMIAIAIAMTEKIQIIHGFDPFPSEICIYCLKVVFVVRNDLRRKVVSEEGQHPINLVLWPLAFCYATTGDEAPLVVVGLPRF